MKEQEIEIFLEHVRRFIDLSPQLRQEILLKSRNLQVNKKSFLVRSGENNQRGFFVIKGCLMHLHLNEEGEHSVLSFAEDQVYPYICSPSYYSHRPENCEIQALEDCLIQEVRREDLEDWAYRFPDFGRYYQALLTEGLKRQYQYSALRLSLNSRKFLEALNQGFPHWTNRIPHKYLAKFMGISQEWFSKQYKELK